MATNEVSWQSAWWALPPLALNSMTQPSGRGCGFDGPALRSYLRSSPIVCAFDRLTVLIRFIAYARLGLPASIVAKKILAARRVEGGEEDVEGQEHRHIGREQGIRSLEQNLWLQALLFDISALPQIIKLMACSGLPWTQAYASFFFVSSFIFEGISFLSTFPAEEPGIVIDDSLEEWMTWFKRSIAR